MNQTAFKDEVPNKKGNKIRSQIQSRCVGFSEIKIKSLTKQKHKWFQILQGNKVIEAAV